MGPVDPQGGQQVQGKVVHPGGEGYFTAVVTSMVLSHCRPVQSGIFTAVSEEIQKVKMTSQSVFSSLINYGLYAQTLQHDVAWFQRKRYGPMVNL